MNAVRMIHLSIHLTGVIILASYSAAVISFLTVEITYLPFTTIQGLIEDNTYKIGVLSDSSNDVFLKVKLC